MEITSIGVANFRSFDEDGVIFNSTGKVNLIIGKNNSGKSNFLRFLKLIAENYKDLGNFPSRNIENQFRRNGKDTELIIGFNPRDQFKELAATSLFGNINETIIRICLREQKITGDNTLKNLNANQLKKLQGKYSTASKDYFLEAVYESIYRQVKDKLGKFSKLVYIPHFRQVKSNPGDENKTNVVYVNGDDVIEKMFTMQHPVLGKEGERETFDLIQNYVRQLVGESDLNIEIPHNKDRIILELHGNRLSLDAFGTGIHQLVIMCMAIAIYKDHTVCIEEPEIHLHPELQRKFLEFIQETDNTYFITTHSNIFLDYKSNVNIYHVKYDKYRSTITHANTNQNSYEILNDLAYKASDLLQSNGIIWVEGPSDRIYLNRWIELLNHEFKEGIHYSIMFYGGRLLSHLTMKSEFFQDDLIPLLKINRNSIVMIDRDGFSSDNKLNETKRRINKETKIQNCWITKGREIENYLSARTIKSFFKDTRDTEINFSHDLDKRIGDQLSKRNKDLNFNYAKNKAGYSKEITKHITKEDLDILDLNLKLSHIENEIKAWNGM